MIETLTTTEAILRRRSTPRFDPDRTVPDALLVRVLTLAGRAPSQHNLQPWRFLVVRDRANRERLRRCTYGHPGTTEAPVVLVLLGYHFPHRTHLAPILEQMKANAGLASDAAARLNAEAQRDLVNERDLSAWACTNVMRASTTLMIAAEGLGLATAPIDRFDSDQVETAFGIPVDHVVCGLIALGYALEEPTSLGRLPLAELCFEEHFGQPWTLGEDE